MFEADDGTILGFIGVFERPMRFNGSRIRLAVTTQLATAPDLERPFVPFQLLRNVFGGDFDLVLADSANEHARKLWLGCGGDEMMSEGMTWLRPLRPARWLSESIVRRLNLPAIAATPGKLVSPLLDRVAAKIKPNRFRQRQTVSRKALTVGMMHEQLSTFIGRRSLVPLYDPSSLEWVLHQAERKQSDGTLQKIAVVDSDDRPIGWYLYYLNPGGTSKVLQIAWRKDRAEDVLGSLYLDAWEKGAVAVRGHVDSKLAHALSRTHCLFFFDGPWRLVYSSDEKVRATVHSGDAWLSGLEGEKWMRFLGG